MRTGAETKVGIITVLAILLLTGYIFYIRGYRAAAAAYDICVIFENARGLQRGDPVRMVGVKIGEVSSVAIDPHLKAEVTLAVDRRYELYENYKFQIATTGIIQERFVEVIPAPRDPYSQQLTPGSCVEGIIQPTLSDLMGVGVEVLENLNRTSRRLNIVLTDQEILTGMREALQGFSQAAKAASELADTTASLAKASEPELLGTLQQLHQAAEDLQGVTAEFRQRIVRGRALEDLEEMARHARETSAHAAQLSATLAELVEDPDIQDKLRGTVSAVYDAAQSAKQVGEDLEVLSAELRKAAPAVSKVAGEAEEIVGTALQPPAIDATFDVLYSGEADRWFPSGSLDFQVRQDRFYRLGIDDIGEENEFNGQVAERQGRATLRYGLVRSRLGIGADLEVSNRATLSLDVFDPNDIRADLLAEISPVPGRSEWSLLLGARDIGEEALFVGGVRLQK